MKAFRGFLIIMTTILFFLGACASTGSSTKTKSPQKPPPPIEKKEEKASGPTVQELKRKQYAGTGQAKGNTFLNARNRAIMDAVRKAVIELIGAESEKANAAKLEEALYNTKNPNAYIFKETLESNRKELVGTDDWVYECTVDVNLDAVRATLNASGVLGGTQTATKELTKEQPAAKEETKEPTLPTAAPDYGEVSDNEKEFIARYVDRMTYMVYFSEDAEEEIRYMKAAVGKANEYLVSKALDIIDAEQIERLKEDQQTVYEEETGESISIIQWIAQKLNSDIYIEIFGKTSGSSQLGGKHYGEASVELKAFEASTALLMGSASYTTLDKAFSQSSQEAARLNAIQAAVYKTMARLLDQVKANMTKTLTRGIRYEVIIQKPLGDRVMSRFWSRLEQKVRSIKSLSQSAEEVKYYVWYIGSLDQLKNIVYDITETISGLENMEMVLSRGKSITFNTGF